MQEIYDKINNHKYLNNDDIKNIVNIYTDGKIKTNFCKCEDFPMGVDINTNSINISKKNKLELLKEIIFFSNIKSKVKNFDNPSTGMVDLYNIYLLFMLLHELEHVKQLNNGELYDFTENIIIKETFKYSQKDYITYLRNHDLYYYEYKAVINSFIEILDIIENKCNKLSKKAIIEFNKMVASIIYHSYGNQGPKENLKLYDKFCSPICYTKFLTKLYGTPNEKLITSICIEDLKRNSKTQYQKLVNGLPLLDETSKYILGVARGEYITSNFIDDIKKEKQKIK